VWFAITGFQNADKRSIALPTLQTVGVASLLMIFSEHCSEHTQQLQPDTVRHARPARSKRGETTRCSLRRVSAMGTPLVQLSHPAGLRGAESGTA
jgi:hypothetical protein